MPNVSQSALENMMYKALIDGAHSTSEKNKDTRKAMVTWDNIFFSICATIMDKLMKTDDISEKEAEKRFEDAKCFLVSKVLVYTRLLPIHARSKVDLSVILDSLIIKTDVSFMH